MADRHVREDRAQLRSSWRRSIHVRQGVTFDVEKGAQAPLLVVLVFGDRGRDVVLAKRHGDVVEKMCNVVGVEFGAGSVDGTTEGCRREPNRLRTWEARDGEVKPVKYVFHRGMLLEQQELPPMPSRPEDELPARAVDGPPYYCASPGCPGRPYRASERPHPPACGTDLEQLRTDLLTRAADRSAAKEDGGGEE